MPPSCFNKISVMTFRRFWRPWSFETLDFVQILQYVKQICRMSISS